MGRSVSPDNPVLVGAFESALRHQALAVVLLLLVAALAWGWQTARGGGPAAGEHPARRVLRVGFGLLWVLDGLLQLQVEMPGGLPAQVMVPAAAASPPWVRHVVAFGASLWSRHPVAAAASAVWIQLGIGVLLLLAPRLRLSQAAGLVSAAWALGVWVFGEGFGGILGEGSSWLFGAPGAAAIYLVAGLLVAAPERWWTGRAGRRPQALLGAYFLAMALLQAWPGRGFWAGGANGGIPSMVSGMAQTPQPSPLHHALVSFGGLASAHGWAVNLFVVVALAALGAALLAGRPRARAVALAGGVALCLATWVLVQDLGFLGGVGTDPNSMVPTILLLWAAVAATCRPAEALAGDHIEVGGAAGAVASPRPAWPSLLASGAAAAVVLVGAVPMVSASVRPGVSAVVAEAVNGQPQSVDLPAPGFTLVDQAGRPVSLASLRDRTVALTFLDPVCISDCPLIASELRQVDLALGPTGERRTAFVAVVANPVYRGRVFVDAFDRQEGMSGLPNWYFLTGSPAALGRVWSAYGISVQTVPAGGMVAHSDQAFVIDPAGRLRWEMGSDPGSTGITEASLGTLVAAEMRSVGRM